MKSKTCLVTVIAPPADQSNHNPSSIANFHFQISNFKFQILFCLLTSSFCLTSPCPAGTVSGLLPTGAYSGGMSAIGDLPTVQTPTIAPAGGSYPTPQKVTLSCATAGANIYYTTNGDAPTKQSTKYTKAFTLSQSATVKARAFKNRYLDSEIALATFTINIVAGPTIAPNGGTFTTVQNVTLSCPTPETMLYYTLDGKEPTNTSTLYGGPFTLNQSATIKVKGFKDGFGTSETATASFTINVVARPTMVPNGGSFPAPQTVTLSCATAGAKIYYTTDGAEPTQASTRCTKAFTLNQSCTLKARAFKKDFGNSEIASVVFTINIVAKPTIEPNGGTFPAPQTVTLSCPTPETTLYYTLDGKEPTNTSTLYGGPFTLNQSATIKVKGFRDGFGTSETASVAFVFSVEVRSCTVTAGKTLGTGTLTLGGTLGATAQDFDGATEVKAQITADLLTPLEFTWPVDDKSFKNGVFNGSRTIGAAQTTFKLDTRTKIFSLSLKNANLQGLCCPFGVEIIIGAYSAPLVLDETLVNGKNPCPDLLLMGMQNSLTADKFQVKTGPKVNTDTLTVSGLFLIEGSYDSGKPLTIHLGAQNFVVPAGSLKFTNNVVICTNVAAAEGIVSVKFDMNLGAYTVTVKNTAISGFGEADFSVDFPGVGLLGPVPVDLGVAYTFWDLSSYDQVGRQWIYDTKLGGPKFTTVTVYSDDEEGYYRIHEDEPDASIDFFYHKHGDQADFTGFNVGGSSLGVTISFNFDLVIWPSLLRPEQTHTSSSPVTGNISVGWASIDIEDGTASLQLSLAPAKYGVSVPAGTFTAAKYDEVLTIKGNLMYYGQKRGTIAITLSETNYADPDTDTGIVKRTRSLRMKFVVTGSGSDNQTVTDIYQLTGN